ncbi:HMA2 domain-containing protein [Phormidesmis priestleyi]
MEQIGYQIVHAIAGRMRIKAVWLETDPEAAGKLQRLIESLSFMTSVRLNPLAQSIVLTYKASAISLEEAQAQLISIIEQVNPVPPPVEPPITETAPPEAPPTTKSTATSESPTSPPTTKSAATSESATSESTATPVIPSPWDDSSELMDDRADMQLHSTASLAKRLNTTSQAITQRRTQPNFDGWTQVQDPDGIAWNYDEASQSFRPVAPLEQETPQTKAGEEIIEEILSETAGAIEAEIEEPSAQVEQSQEVVTPSPRKQRKLTKSSEKGQSPKKPRTQS